MPDLSNIGLVATSRKSMTHDLKPLLEVTRHLAAPFDLEAMLAEVISAAKQILDAERGTVWLYDEISDGLILQVATGIAPVNVPAGKGLVGSCALSRQIINVTDCYADPRFNPDLDRQTNYRTRCMLTLPLVDHKDALVGVLQVLNKRNGVFDVDDEELASSLAAQCAVAIQRVRMTDALFEGEKMRQELETARVVQMSSLPATMPSIPGYEVFGSSMPADMTGGDTYDVALLGANVLLVLGDATGHGLAPALHVTQMHAMLRMAFRLGVDLDTAYQQLNNQLNETLPDDRFITAFIGLLDTSKHEMRYHSGGQAPILHYIANDKAWRRYGPTCFPLAAMPIVQRRPAVDLPIESGDILVLLSDGIYEYHDRNGEMFGEQRVMDLVTARLDESLPVLSESLMAAVKSFAAGAPQEDDITIVFMRRTPENERMRQVFSRTIDSLQEIFAFTARASDAYRIDPSLMTSVDFTIEELFTNMVKYSKMSVSDVDIELVRLPLGIEVTLTDHDVDLFDVTQAPDVDVSRPIEQRVPGGLGLHLIRRLVDNIEYHYDPITRQSMTRFSKSVLDPATDPQN
jgi:sigma-B regulation protein RsbU (phosphoserine phosphatase)